MEERRLAEPEDRDVDHRFHFGEARILEMRDGHRVIALALGLERVADEIARDAEFGDGVGRRSGWRSRIEGPGEPGVENRLQVRLHLVDVGRMLDAVGRALEPDFVLAHLLSIRASTRRGLPLPLRIFNGAATTTAPVGGSWSRLARHCRP